MKTMNLTKLMRHLGVGAFLSLSICSIYAQPLPQNPPQNAPQTPIMNPMVGNAIGGPGPVIGISPANNNAPAPQPAPAPAPPTNWGSPWWNSPFATPAPALNTSNLNNGEMKVIACGYDAMGVWRVLPLFVQYAYNGIQYNVTVLNAWDPWTDMWNTGVDVQAFNTDYTLRGVNYNYYVVLSFGTFYFNL